MMDGFRRRTPAVLLFLMFCVAGALVAAQPPGKVVVDLMKAAGTLRGEGKNAKASGALGLKSYRVHELSLAEAVTVDVGGKAVSTTKAWRLTITGGPFAVRAVPATIEIDGVPAGIALESEDRSELRMVTFDTAALHQGAQVTVAYGETRFPLPESLDLNR